MKYTVPVKIIGGADGPTAVFVAGKLGDGAVVGIVIIGIILLAVGILVYKWKKK